MRVIFMGTPDFAVPTLRETAKRHEITAVFCQPDKPKGRGLTLTPPPVKQASQELGISVYQPERVKDAETIERITAMQPDCIVVVAYGKLLPKEILDCPRYGCVNVHSSLLPKYRGSSPIQYAIMNGDKKTGVTTMLLDEGMDTGDILMQAETPISDDDTCESVHDRLAQMGAKLLTDTLEGLEKGTITPIKQDDALSSRAPMLDKELARIDWSQSARQVHDKIRGLCGWPVAETTVGSKRLRIHRSRLSDCAAEGRPGEIVSLDPLTVACGSGCIELEVVQADGTKKMPAADYLRGHRTQPGTILGK